MADTKVSAYSVAASLADTDVLLGVNGGATKKFDLNTLTAYFESRGRQNNASVSTQTPTAATDTYIVGSDVLIPTGRLQAKSKYRLRMYMSKTATGTTGMQLQVRIGTAATTADASRSGVMAFSTQTAVIDSGTIDLDVTFRTVGSGTSAVIQCGAILDHLLAATGFASVNSSVVVATSSGFDSTVAGLRIGCSLNSGTGTALTITQVTAELTNLA